MVCFDYFEHLLSTIKPDLIITNAYASMPHLILYEVAKKMKIQIIRPMSIRLGKNYILSESAMEQEFWINDYLEGKKIPKEGSLIKAKNFIREFRESPPPPYYQKIKNSQKLVTVGHLYRFLRYAFQFWFTAVYKNDHTKVNPLRRLIKESQWRVSKRLMMRLGFWDKFTPTERYIYFPLHVQPEMSTMTFAPYYLDQLAVLANISKSMPIGFKLVVKEHPSMLGHRTQKYYKQLRALPNMLLISPFENNAKILKAADLIFTITGTVGLEGLILKKPVIVLGSVFFKYCPLVFDAAHIAPPDWPALIDKALNDYRYDETILVNFMAALFDRSFEGVYIETLACPDIVLERQNLKILMDNILNYVNH